MKFEWDETKNFSNLDKHGLTLSEAQHMWEGRVLEIDSTQPGEPRKLAIGKISGKFWTAIFTRRGESIRIISVRRCRDNKKNLYHEKNEH